MATKQERVPILMTEREIAESTPNLGMIEQALSLVEKVQINRTNLTKNEILKQEAELEKRKVIARELVEDFLHHTQEYFDVVIQLVNFTRTSVRFAMEDWKYQERMKEIDSHRRACHHALTDSLIIAVRYIRLNFGELSEMALEQFEEESKKRKQIMLNVFRSSFPRNIMCPEQVDIENRNSVADWAEKVVEEMKFRDLAPRPKKEKDRD